MCIGKANKPRFFKKKSGKELGIDCYNNSKAWMTTQLLFSRLFRFSSYITRINHDRRVLVLIDNCSAHGSEESLPPLDNVEVRFLPPNTTSRLQPLDAGIIASVKPRYRKYLYEKALDCLDASVSIIYQLDQLTAMRAIQKIWEELPASVMEKCWNYTGLVAAEVVRQTQREDVAGVLVAVGKHVPQQAQMSIDLILNPSGENEVIKISDERTLASVAVQRLL